jgi:hypothetical protein
MDIKDGFTTSSKEQLRSLVHVHELDEVTGPGWAWACRSNPAGLAHSESRFGPPFLAPEGSSTLSP